jgi:hypothetical protein
VGVYRQENAEHVRRLIDPALRAGWVSAWWALDDTDPRLADYTVGEGPGLKLPLVNLTLKSLVVTPEWTVISDDDLRFRRGDVVRFIRLCEKAKFDLAQPARARGTQFSHAITTRVRFSRARATTFVEVGPLFAVGRRFRDKVLPLPEHRGMGWGTELDWFDLFEAGSRLGIVDATSVEHLGVLAKDYDYTEVKRRLTEEFAARGRARWEGMRETVDIWRPWRQKPPWATET